MGPGGGSGPRPGSNGPGNATGPTNAAASLLNNPAGNASVDGKLPARILCMPQDPMYTGVDGPTLIVQTPEQITWAAEEMHHIRRIFLEGGYSDGFRPNYLGEAVGHWEGNTLVVETRGLEKQPPGTVLIEHWTKNEEGTVLTISYAYRDTKGNETRNGSLALSWQPNQEVLEWMCEDYNEEWLPGGEDYEDQIR